MTGRDRPGSLRFHLNVTTVLVACCLVGASLLVQGGVSPVARVALLVGALVALTRFHRKIGRNLLAPLDRASARLRPGDLVGPVEETGVAEARSAVRTCNDVQDGLADRVSLESQLRQAQKMESLGRLAAGIAHEINTPIQFVGDNLRFLSEAFDDLTAVLAAYRAGDAKAAATLEADTDASFLLAEVPDALAQTLDGVARVAGIVRAMKAFGHPANAEKAPADLNETVRNTLVVAGNEVKYVAEVVTDLGALPPVWCHVGDISQVLLNLVVNAAHAVGAAVGDSGTLGTITVRTRVEGDDAVLEVADSGAGIAPDIAHRIFEPFFTTKEMGSGTGQGLTLVRSLVVDRHGGSITFSSEPGVGTTFTVRLPTVGRAEHHLTEALV